MFASRLPLPQVRLLIVLTLLLAPMAVRTTPPVPAPYYEFRLEGRLVRTGGGSPENFVVGLADRPQDTWDVLGEGLEALSITSEIGEFRIIARTYEPLDSLAVVLVLPGEELMVADVFARESVEPKLARGYDTPVRESDGCCEDDRTVAAEYVMGYIYEYPEKWITIP